MSLVNNTIANYLGQIWISLMGFIFVPFYISYLGMEAYGLIGFLLVLQAWFAFFDMSVSPAVTREVACYRIGVNNRTFVSSLIKTIEVLTIFLAISIVVIFYFHSENIAKIWIKSDNLDPKIIINSIVLISIIIVLRFFESLYRGVLFGINQHVWFNFYGAISATLKHGGGVLILIFFAPRVEYLFYWQIFISLISIPILKLKITKIIPAYFFRSEFNIKMLDKIKKFTTGIFVVTILSIVYTQIDKILISKFLKLDVLASYMLSTTLASIMYAVVVPVTQAFYPNFIELINLRDSDKLSKNYHLAAQIITILVLPIAVIFVFFGYEVIYAWSGDIDLAKKVAPILLPLAIGTFINSLMHVPYQMQLANGWVNLSVKINIFIIIVFVPSILFIIPEYGAIGAAWSWVGINLVMMFLVTIFMHKKVPVHNSTEWLLQDILLPLCGTLLVAVTAKIFFAYVQINYRVSLFIVLFLIGCGAALAALLFAGVAREKLFSKIRIELK